MTATTRTCGSARAGTAVTTGSLASPTGTTGAGGCVGGDSGGDWLRAVAGTMSVIVVPGPSFVVVVVVHPAPSAATSPIATPHVLARPASMPVSGSNRGAVHPGAEFHPPGIPSGPATARGTPFCRQKT